jgi:hypothetical protein
MKTISNKEVKITTESGLMHRSDLLVIVTNEPGERGIKISEQRERMRILEVIEKADKGDITLEDADFNKLKTLYEAFGWTAVHKDLTDLADHLDELAKQK